jgi:hypothetical protein
MVAKMVSWRARNHKPKTLLYTPDPTIITGQVHIITAAISLDYGKEPLVIIGPYIQPHHSKERTVINLPGVFYQVLSL